eukprot:1187667-Prorocentrum_minimum.AAC.9
MASGQTRSLQSPNRNTHLQGISFDNDLSRKFPFCLSRFRAKLSGSDVRRSGRAIIRPRDNQATR